MRCPGGAGGSGPCDIGMHYTLAWRECAGGQVAVAAAGVRLVAALLWRGQGRPRGAGCRRRFGVSCREDERRQGGRGVRRAKCPTEGAVHGEPGAGWRQVARCVPAQESRIHDIGKVGHVEAAPASQIVVESAGGELPPCDGFHCVHHVHSQHPLRTEKDAKAVHRHAATPMKRRSRKPTVPLT